MKSVKTNISTATWWSRPVCVCTITIRRHAVPRVHVWRRDIHHTEATDRTGPMVSSTTSRPSLTGAISRCCLLQDALLHLLWTQEDSKKKRQQCDDLKKQSRALNALCTSLDWSGKREKEHLFIFNDLFIRVRGQWLYRAKYTIILITWCFIVNSTEESDSFVQSFIVCIIFNVQFLYSYWLTMQQKMSDWTTRTVFHNQNWFLHSHCRHFTC